MPSRVSSASSLPPEDTPYKQWDGYTTRHKRLPSVPTGTPQIFPTNPHEEHYFITNDRCIPKLNLTHNFNLIKNASNPFNKSKPSSKFLVLRSKSPLSTGRYQIMGNSIFSGCTDRVRHHSPSWGQAWPSGYTNMLPQKRFLPVGQIPNKNYTPSQSSLSCAILLSTAKLPMAMLQRSNGVV